MRFRQLHRGDTGQWLDVLFTVEGDAFSIPEESQRESIATALGLAAEDLVTVEDTTDVRSGVLIKLPETGPDATRVRLDRIAELNAIPRSDWTTAEMRELINLMAQDYS